MTVVGWTSWSNKIAPTVPAALGGLHMMIYVADDDAPAVNADPSVPATYANEKVMWTGGSTLPGTPVEGSHHEAREINLNTKRRITSGMDVRFVLFNGGSTAIQVNGVLRALVRMGGN